MPKRQQLTKEDEAEAREFFAGDLPDRAVDTRWQRGKSGNPKGRPVLPDNIDDILGYRVRRFRVELADKLITLALAGNLEAIKYIYDRQAGKPRQSVEQQVTIEHPIVAALRKLNDDTSALQGRPVKLALEPGPVTTAEVREATGDRAGSGI